MKTKIVKKMLTKLTINIGYRFRHNFHDFLAIFRKIFRRKK